jgi:hypothetical protein
MNHGSVKNIFYLSMFLTIYLTLFFLVNFRPDAVIIVKNRIKRLRESLFEQLYMNSTGQQRAKWVMELEQRRMEIHCELKNNLKFSGIIAAMSNSTEKEIDSIIDAAWNELLAVMRQGSYAVSDLESPEEVFDEELEELAAIEGAEYNLSH